MDSAAGTVKNARDSKTQAVFPLRGKVLNVEQASEVDVYNNKELKELIISLGCGIKEDIDLKKLRYHKIIISTDADADGSEIALLLLTFFFRYMPDLILKGHVYISQSPLFINKIGSKTYYIFDEKEQEKFLLDHANDKISDIQRIKGLGELNAGVFRDQVMNPKNRRLLQVGIDNLEEADFIIRALKGKDTSFRKKIITTGTL